MKRKKMQLGLISSREAIIKHNTLESYWSYETKLTQKIIISLLASLEEISNTLKRIEHVKPKQKRKLSAWQEFIKIGLKEGKTIQQLSKEWKKNTVSNSKESESQ